MIDLLIGHHGAIPAMVHGHPTAWLSDPMSWGAVAVPSTTLGKAAAGTAGALQAANAAPATGAAAASSSSSTTTLAAAAAQPAAAAAATAAGAVAAEPSGYSCDPQEWGPPAWKLLHSIVEQLPGKVPTGTQAHFREFMGALPDLLPCKPCGKHLEQTLQALPALDEAHLGTRDEAVKWMVQLHNAVNEQLGKPAIPLISGSSEQGLQLAHASVDDPSLLAASLAWTVDDERSAGRSSRSAAAADRMAAYAAFL